MGGGTGHLPERDVKEDIAMHFLWKECPGKHSHVNQDEKRPI